MNMICIELVEIITTQPLNQNKMKTTLELLRERLLKDKEIFPHYNEYINGILYDIDNELLAMEKEYLERFYNQGYTQCSIEDLEHKSRERFVDAEDYYNKTFKSE